MPATALGFRVHSGWAAVVAVGGSITRPEVLHRARIELVEGKVPKQPFHAVEHLPLPEAEQLLRQWRATANRLASAALRSTLKLLREGKHEPRCGVLLASSGRPLPPLAGILASHAIIHAAEGEFFRDVIAHASQACALPLLKIVEKQLFVDANIALRMPPEELKDRLNGMRAQVGSPWTADEKLSALAAFTALSRRSR